MFYSVCVNYKQVRPHCDYFVTVDEFFDEPNKAVELAKIQTLPCMVVARDYLSACYGGVADKVIYKNF